MGYRFPFLKPEHAYYDAWREMRRRRAWVWWSLASILPGVALAIAVTVLTQFEAALIVFGLAAFVPYAIAMFRFTYWKCPRCRKAFFVDFIGTHYFNDACCHCELPLYAPCDPAEQQWEMERSKSVSRF